jgi:L-ribulokinase
MSTTKYAIGLDFGTESGRAVLVDVSDGREVAEAVHPYQNGVIDEVLPGSGVRLPPDWALQDPADYLEVLKTILPAVLQASRVDPADVIGLGVDFTANTILPVQADGTPLCFLPEYRSHPHAWTKLWKHHSAQPEANRMTEIAHRRGEAFLKHYGGKISSEWCIPKVWQMVDEAPEIYAAADRIIEAGDWLVWQLTGVETHNSCAAGYKSLWSKREGFPSDEFFKALDPRLEHCVDEKLAPAGFILPPGAKAGELSKQAAAWTGLRAGIAVAAAHVDAHVAVPAATVTGPGRMVIIMGTSNCHMVLGAQEKAVPGMCGCVEDGIVPGWFGFEAGQSCVGDLFAWYVENCVPARYEREAEQQGVNVHTLLEQKAAALKPGQSGLMALDWWNGNRSVLVDVDLTGLLVGMTLTTKPEEIYRALIEATAYGTRVIIKTFEKSGVAVNEIVATGGLPNRNRLLMQIYADVTGREVKLASAKQTSAVGAAMHGAVAAGCFADIGEASRAMAHLRDEVYRPDPHAQAVYERLFREYLRLHDAFGRDADCVMKRLKAIKTEALRNQSS